jgi:hypothetical protein
MSLFDPEPLHDLDAGGEERRVPVAVDWGRVARSSPVKGAGIVMLSPVAVTREAGRSRSAGARVRKVAVGAMYGSL